MVEILGWADRSRSYDLTLGRTMSKRNAEHRYQSGFRVAAEVAVPGCERASVTLDPKVDLIRVEFLNWPDGIRGKAQLHFLRPPGEQGYALVKASLTRGAGPAETWSQAVLMPLGGDATALLDLVSEQTRHTLPLAGSDTHAEVGAMRFHVPAFGNLDELVRTDLVERCMLAPSAFDPDLRFGLDEDAGASPATPSP